jgi:hypothetical protein
MPNLSLAQHMKRALKSLVDGASARDCNEPFRITATAADGTLLLDIMVDGANSVDTTPWAHLDKIEAAQLPIRFVLRDRDNRSVTRTLARTEGG